MSAKNPLQQATKIAAMSFRQIQKQRAENYRINQNSIRKHLHRRIDWRLRGLRLLKQIIKEADAKHHFSEQDLHCLNAVILG